MARENGINPSLPRRRDESSEENKHCEIDNPLAHLSARQLYRDARSFAKKVFPVDEERDEAFWETAALVARNQQVPYKCSHIHRLTPSQKNAIRMQRTLSFWEQPKALRVTIITLCFSAITQGWVQTGLNGANLKWGYQMGLANEFGPPTQTQGVWVFSAINAALYFSASILGCWFSDPLQSLIIGRRGAIFVSACLCLAGAIGSACSQTWPQLLGSRIVLGAGLGAKASVTPIYGAEVSPSHLRGALVMNWQLFDAFGIFLGFAANLIVSQSGNASWRYELGSAAIPTICLLSLVWTIPESPRWLLKKGRYTEAFASFCAIRETTMQAAAEMFYTNAQLQAELRLLQIPVLEPEQRELRNMAPTSRSSRAGHGNRYPNLTGNNDKVELDDYQRRAKNSYYPSRIWDLFYIPRIRRATTAAAVVMIAQQMCGINILQFYSTTIFHVPNPESQVSLVGHGLSLGLGFANFLFTFPIYRFIDKRGRRFLLLASYPGMILSLLAACLAYNIKDDSNRLAVVVMFMFIFVFFYSWGQGPVPFAYSSEVFPLLNREAGMSFAVFVNLFGAGVLALVIPQLTRSLAPAHGKEVRNETGESRVFAIFTVLNVIALALIFFLVPETAGAMLGSDDVTDATTDEAQGLNHISLEELNYIFSAKTRQHISYQLRHMLPWAWKMLGWKLRRHVLGRDEERPEDPYQLYTWVQVGELNELADDTDSEG